MNKKTNSKMITCTRWGALLLLLCLGIVQRGRAQAPAISYPVQAQDLSSSYSTGLLTVKLVFNGACSGPTSVRVALPASVTYVPGSVVKTAGNAAMTITESSIADPNNPVFSIGGIAAAGDSITFTVSREATCSSLATAKDSIYVFTSGGCSNASEVSTLVNTYNIFAPSLAITPPAAMTNAVIGTAATRTITIVNGGNGPTDMVRFYTVYPGGGMANTSGTNTITANGTGFVPASTSGDTLFYKIYGTTLFGGNNLLTNGETITITEPVKVVKCNTSTTYGAGWGRTDVSQCQVTTATSAVTMATGVPNLAVAWSTVTPVSGACDGYAVTVTYTNTGIGGNAGALYDIAAVLGNVQINTPVGRYGFSADDPRLNGSIALTYTYGGGDAPNIVPLAQLGSDPDAAGTGLEDLDGDGQYDDLAPGQSFNIVYSRKVIYTGACGFQYAATAASQLQYNSMCKGSTVVASAINNAPYSHGWQPNGVSKLAPPSVYNGLPFTVRVCQTGSFLPPAPSPTDSLELSFTLPPGVTYAGNASFNGAAAPHYAVQTGNILNIRQKWLNGSISSGFCMSFDLVYDCSGSGALNLPFTINYVADRSCDAIYKIICSDNITIATHCPAPCSTGVANHVAQVRRTDFGWTDGTLSTKVNPATLPALSIKTVTLLDTINIKESGVQNGSYNNLYYYFQEDKAAGLDVFNYLGGTFHYKALGTGTEVVCNLPVPDASASTSTLTRLTFNITPLLGGSCGLPATLNSTDSFWVDMNYSIGDLSYSPLYGITVQSPANGMAKFYNLDASNVQQYCDVANPEVYVLGLQKDAAIDYSHPVTISGCTPTNYYLQDYRLFMSEPQTPFPYEYRPTQYIDSIVITLPNGVSVDLSHPVTIDYQNLDIALGSVGGNFPVTPVISGNKMSLINDGSWKISGIDVVNTYNNARPQYYILPTCALDPAYTDMGVTYYTHDFYYSGLHPQTTSTFNRVNALTYNATTKPSITVQNNTGIVQGVLNQQYWDVQVNNPSTQTAPYLWLALEKSAGSGIVVDSVVLKPSNIVMSPLSYGAGNKWYQVSTAGLSSGNSQQARVYFKYTNCNPDSILLKSGWNCTGYPSPDPGTGYACSPAQAYLNIVPQPSQIQLSVLRQPGNGSPVSLCNQDSAVLVLNSAQAANLVNPYLVFYPPAGVTLVGSIPVEYPLGSGNYQNISPVSLGGGGYKIDLTAHTGIGTNGMLGTASASSAYSPLGGDRQAKVRLVFNTDCAYSSGTSFVIYAFGSRPCGSAATGNSSSATTAALNISGASVAGGAGISMSFGAVTSATCGTAVPVSLTTTPTSVPTIAGDTVVYTLPIGMAYGGGLTAGFNAVVTGGAGAPTLIKIAMPVGISSGTPINYSFIVQPEGTSCGVINITGDYRRSITGLMCGATACTGSSVVIASGTSPAITLQKPSMVINSMSTGTTSWIIGFSQPVHLSYSNNGTAASVANTDTVEFFCGSSTTPFAKRPLTKSVAVGASDSDVYTIIVPSAAACVSGSLVTAKIQAVTAAGTQQCLCAGANFTMAGVPLPLTFLTAGTTTDNCAVAIDWTYNNSEAAVTRFIIERSSNGDRYDAVANLRPATTHYTDVSPHSGSWYYRIRAVTVDGKDAYSKTLAVHTTECNGNTIKVYPNPVAAQVQVVLQGAGAAASYELADELGRILQKGSLNLNANNTVDIGGVASGVYILKVYTDGNMQAQQLHIIH